MSCFKNYFEFYPGEDKDLTITLNILNSLTGCKDAMDLTGITAADITVDLPANPANLLITGSPIVITSAVKGIITLPLTGAQSLTMESGAIVVTVVKAGKTTIFVAGGASKRMIISNC